MRLIFRGVLWISAILVAAALLGAIARPPLYLVAKYRGYKANLRGATLAHVNLIRVDLDLANLRGADLRGADLRGADLRGADLRGADLRGADLGDADLRGADLAGANVTGTKYDYFARWPVGFDPKAHGAVFVPAVE